MAMAPAHPTHDRILAMAPCCHRVFLHDRPSPLLFPYQYAAAARYGVTGQRAAAAHFRARDAPTRLSHFLADHPTSCNARYVYSLRMA